MSSHTLRAIGGGGLSALAWLSAALGLPGGFGLVFAYLAPLPLLLVGLGLGGTSVLPACAVALVLVFAFGGLPAVETFGGVLALPCWLISHLALRARRQANGAGVAWQPIGTILAVLAVTSAVGLAVVGLALAGGDGLEATVRELLDKVGQMPEVGGSQQVALLQPLVPVFPGMLAVAWQAMLVINAVLAQMMLARRGQALRASPRWSSVELPDWMSWLLVGSAAVALITDGDLSYVAHNLSVALMMPFFFVGLAVVHCCVGRLAARRPLLIAFYFMLLMLFMMVAVVVTALGVLDQWRVLRLRPDPANPGTPGPTRTEEWVMEIILLERVENLGQMGDVVRVKPGFARNYLLPLKKAVRATDGNRKRFDAQRSQLEATNLERRADAQAVGGKIDGLTVTLIRQAGEGGQLYGSATARDVADAVAAAGFSVRRQQIRLNQPIKTLGLHAVGVSLHPEVTVMITVNVARTPDEAELQRRGGRGAVVEAVSPPPAEDLLEDALMSLEDELAAEEQARH